MPGIALEFRKDESVIAHDRLTLADADEAVILHTYFDLPVRFASGQAEFFEWAGDPWLPVPVLHLATTGYDEVMKAYSGALANYYIAETGHRLVLERKENQIRILSTLNRSTDVVDVRELLNAFEIFALRIKNLVVEEAPEILVHEYWRKWLGVT